MFKPTRILSDLEHNSPVVAQNLVQAFADQRREAPPGSLFNATLNPFCSVVLAFVKRRGQQFGGLLGVESKLSPEMDGQPASGPS